MPRRNTSTPLDPVTSWARKVLGGTVVAGPHVRNACRRHLADLEHGPARGLSFEIEAAQRGIGFFRDVLRLAGGQFEGRKFELHPSQQFIIGSLFGWKRSDGTRRFRRAYIEASQGQRQIAARGRDRALLPVGRSGAAGRGVCGGGQSSSSDGVISRCRGYARAEPGTKRSINA